MKDIYFTPGPAELYFTVEGHIKNALRQQIPSISHRSKLFESVYEECVENLKTLLAIPEDYHVFFTASATEIWEKVLENNVANRSHHYVNGAFSKRFSSFAEELGKQVTVEKAEEGSRVIPHPSQVAQDAELLAFTLNETSTGVSQPLDEVYAMADALPDKLVALDAVSIMPYPELDYSKLDTVFFSVQKGFGLPAGLGVWIMSPRSVEKAQRMQREGYRIGTYHSIPSLLSKAQKNQTPETPNVLNIYLLAKVCGDMLEKGISRIRQETDYKASLLYHTLEEHAQLKPFVKDPHIRSKVVIVAETENSSSEIIDQLKENRLIVGGGYGSYNTKHIRIANFPTHSKEQFEQLVDRINLIK